MYTSVLSVLLARIGGTHSNSSSSDERDISDFVTLLNDP
jgi:hypothetical protein